MPAGASETQGVQVRLASSPSHDRFADGSNVASGASQVRLSGTTGGGTTPTLAHVESPEELLISRSSHTPPTSAATDAVLGATSAVISEGDTSRGRAFITVSRQAAAR